MNILFVENSINAQGNGLCASVRRTMRLLQERGYNVRILSMDQEVSNPKGADVFVPDYVLQPFHVPVFQGLIESQGFCFAKSDRAVIERAVDWADVIHLQEPFPLQIVTARIAKKKGKPCVGTYHLHPENVFCSVGLGKAKLLNGLTLFLWEKLVFDHCQIVQCPSENVRQRLQRYGCRAELRVISNGMERTPNSGKSACSASHFSREDDVSSLRDGYFNILSVGRYSVEKDQETLLQAMKYSKHSREIRLILAGQGPTEEKLRRQAAELIGDDILSTPPIFHFFPKEQLPEIYPVTDLYVHCAFIEVEGLGCMETIQHGIVPVIAESPLSATSEFALHKANKYPAQDPKALARRIDFWIEHPRRRAKEAQKYTTIEEKYDVDWCTDQLEEMYHDVV